MFYAIVEDTIKRSDENDTFDFSEDFVEDYNVSFTGQLSKSILAERPVDNRFIEKVLKSNLKDLYYKRIKVELFYNREESHSLKKEFKKETKRLLKYIDNHEIINYLAYCATFDERIPRKIEKKFGLTFKNRLLSRRSAVSEKRFDLVSIRKQWDEIANQFSEDEVMQYFIYVLYGKWNFRNMV